MLQLFNSIFYNYIFIFFMKYRKVSLIKVVITSVRGKSDKGPKLNQPRCSYMPPADPLGALGGSRRLFHATSSVGVFWPLATGLRAGPWTWQLGRGWLLCMYTEQFKCLSVSCDNIAQVI